MEMLKNLPFISGFALVDIQCIKISGVGVQRIQSMDESLTPDIGKSRLLMLEKYSDDGSLPSSGHYSTGYHSLGHQSVPHDSGYSSADELLGEILQVEFFQTEIYLVQKGPVINLTEQALSNDKHCMHSQKI